MHTKTIAELSKLLHSKQITSVELTQHFLNRIKAHNKELNCFITVCEETALTQAKLADERLANGTATPLTGVPIAQKDIFCTKGIKTTCGSRMLENFDAPYESTVTEKFHAAGAVMLGKTNMDEFAMGSSNENSYFGSVKNPWDTKTVPGGSSGGSSACVAARLAPGSTGTDTGGSIRQPASLTGICGLKPTYGRVSRWGMIAFASSLDQAGPFAQTSEDMAMLLNVMAGFDEKDSTSAEQAVPDYTEHLHDSIKGLRIGVPVDFFKQGLDPEVEKVIRAALKQYEDLGATLHDVELPHNDAAIAAYYVIAPAECSSNLSRFDGVRYGYRCNNPENLNDLYSRSRAEGFGSEVKRRIMTGAYALSAGFYDAYYIKAQKIRRLVKQDFVTAFKNVDVIMGPTSPSVAFNIGERTADPLAMYLSDMYTIAVNLAGLPGASIPAGFANHLPVGLQIIGNYFDESKILNVAHQFQQATNWHQQHPEKF